MTAIYDTEKPDANECFSKLIKAKASFGKVLLNKTNPHLKNKYADLSSVFDAIETALTANDLFISQNGEMLDGSFFIRTILFDSNGSSIDFGIVPVRTTKDDAQNLGSGLTYARRYGLITALGLVGEEDDDGNEATGIVAKQSVKHTQERLKALPHDDQVKILLINKVVEYGDHCMKKGYTAKDVQQALNNVPSKDLNASQASEAIKKLEEMLKAKEGAV